MSQASTLMNPSYLKYVSLIGFAIFSMFFGSGNLVFPLGIGQEALSLHFIASIAISITGIFLPFLGVIAVLRYHGNTDLFFGRFGKFAAPLISLILLGLLGPFGVVPRCITVAYGSFTLLFEDFSLLLFSSIICALIYVMGQKRDTLVETLGRILTPILLISIALIIIRGIWGAGDIPPSTHSTESTFWMALKEGYHTMDLLAAFFFAKVIHDYIANKITDEHDQNHILYGSVFVAMVLFIIVYGAFVYLGAAYAPLLADVAPQQYLGVIAQTTMTHYGKIIVCCAVMMACITTASILAYLFADYIHTLTRLNFKLCFVASLLISLVFSTLNFQGISAFLSPILSILYPLLIVMTFINIIWVKKVDPQS